MIIRIYIVAQNKMATVFRFVCSSQYLKLTNQLPSLSSPGGVRDTAPGEDRQDLINEAGKQEIPLTLTNKFEKLATDDESTNMRELFVR